jgi:hypothetical protein
VPETEYRTFFATEVPPPPPPPLPETEYPTLLVTEVPPPPPPPPLKPEPEGSPVFKAGGNLRAKG